MMLYSGCTVNSKKIEDQESSGPKLVSSYLKACMEKYLMFFILQINSNICFGLESTFTLIIMLSETYTYLDQEIYLATTANCLIFHVLFLSLVQEEIKITSITVFVNPYTEPDEEEEKEKAKDEKNAEDEENVSFESFDNRVLAFLGFYF
jgi:predicted membrane protein